MKKIFEMYVLVFCGLFATLSAAEECNISGVWKHSNKNAWLNFDLSGRKIVVHHNEGHPEVRGLTVIKNLKNKDENWHGDMYSSETNSYFPVVLKVSNCDQISVSKYEADVFDRVVRSSEVASFLSEEQKASICEEESEPKNENEFLILLRDNDFSLIR